MPGTVTFDTHSYIKRLKQVGFTEEQAEVQAETLNSIIDERLATKQDIAALETNLQRDIKELEYRITLRLGGMLAAAIAVIAALVKLL